MKANTKEIRNIASEINAKAVEYQIILSKMYRKFTDMPNVTQEWVGGRAKEYVNIVLLDKEEFMKVGETLKSYARALNDIANLIEDRSAKIRKDEEHE